MKIYFFNLGNSSNSGGFSSYTKFISESDINSYIHKFSDFGTIDKNSTNIFFKTTGKDNINFLDFLFHKFNQITFFIFFVCLLFWIRNTTSQIWIQSSFISRSRLIRYFASRPGNINNLIIDVRDKEFFPYIDSFTNFKFIACGTEINKKISKQSKRVFNLKTPLSFDDKKLIHSVQSKKYLVYAHGIQKDKSPESILKLLDIINSSEFILIICGRLREKKKGLVKQIINHKNVRYVGSLDKLVILALLKSCYAIVLTGRNEGVPRIFEEAKNFSIPVITEKSEVYLGDYEKRLTFDEFANNILTASKEKIEDQYQTKMQENLKQFIIED